MAKTIFYIDGGAGRVLTAIPALLKYHRLNPDTDWAVLIPAWDFLYWGIPELQDRTYGVDTKGIFDNVVYGSDKIITPEPYRNPAYFRQEISLAEAFDREINNTTNHSDLGNPVMVFNKQEITVAKATISDLKNIQKRQKTVIFQPYGRGAKVERDEIMDEESRSLDSRSYLALVRKLAQRYNMIFFGEPQFQQKADTFAANYTCDLRQWGALIQESDYFIGVDSVGQHMARALRKPGTVLIGSTFAKNTSYPDYFNIIEKPGAKKYSPIRITGLDSVLANRLNENTMRYSDKEINDIYENIVRDIEKKVR
jgi:ADP-heptose:LPS heptosyltransferase